MWDEVTRFAKARSDAAWKKLEAEGLIEEPTTQGDHALCVSSNFVVTALVSKPVRRFSADALAAALKARYKVPEPVTKTLVEEAKVPTKPSITYAVIEKSN